jgi:hypothetical protein
MAIGASTATAGESAEAGKTEYEEVVKGNIPVSHGGGVVEQGVQVEQTATDETEDQQGYTDQHPSGQDWPSKQEQA